MEYNFIKNDPEEILSQIISKYQSESQEVLNPADAERIIIDCMAYREVLLRGQIEHLMGQNFVQYAQGLHLDNWGALFGVVRRDGEGDDDYRVRVLSSNHSSIGTLSAYKNRVLSVDNVLDVLFQRKNDDKTLAPGVVRVIPLMKSVDNNMLIHGVSHSEVLENRIDAVLYSDDFGVIGAHFDYVSATSIALSGEVSITPIVGYNKEQVRSEVELQIAKHFAVLSLKFSNEFDMYELERELAVVEGVLSVSNVQFANVPVKKFGEFYVKGDINLTVY